MTALPVFMINLDRRPDRREAMEERLDGVAYTRMPAVDGNSMDPSALPVRGNGAAPLSVNEYACLESHRSVARRILDEGAELACVLEDDVLLSPAFGDFVADASWFPASADVVKIETFKTKVWLDRRSESAGSRRVRRLRSFHFGTAGYVLTRGAAERLLVSFGNAGLAADDILFGRALETGELGRIHQLSPALVVQEMVCAGDSAGSDIEGAREKRMPPKNKRSGLKKLAHECGRPFRQLSGRLKHFSQQRVVVPFE